MRTAAGRHAAGALSKAAPGAFAAQAGYELGKQASPYIAKGVPGLFGPGAAEQAGKGVTDIDWRPSEIGKTLKYMLQPGEQQRESLNLQLSTQSLKEIIQEEVSTFLKEGFAVSKQDLVNAGLPLGNVRSGLYDRVIVRLERVGARRGLPALQSAIRNLGSYELNNPAAVIAALEREL